MLAGGKSPLIWPLLDKLSMVAHQRRPRSAANLGLVRIPTMPWDDGDRPGAASYGQVESDPRLWELAQRNFGLAKIGVQSARLESSLTNPRAAATSAQRLEPAVIHALALQQFLPPAPPPRDARQTSRIIWPLRDKLLNPNLIVRSAPNNLRSQSMVPGVVFAQQKPNAVARILPILPWDRADAPTEPGVVHALAPLPATRLRIFGVTKDSAGIPIGGCTVHLYRTTDDAIIDSTVSDGSGNYEFRSAAPSRNYYAVAYKVGSPDVAGTTLNTLQGLL